MLFNDFIEFDFFIFLLLDIDFENQFFVGNFVGNIDVFNMSGDGFLYVNIGSVCENCFMDFFEMRMVKYRGNVVVEISWEVEMDMMIIYCEDCGESDFNLGL